MTERVKVRVDVRDRWAIVLVVLLWAWVIVPKVIQSTLSPKFKNSVGEDNGSYSALASLADYSLYLSVIVTCVLVFILSLNTKHRSGFLVMATMLIPWAYLVVRDFYEHLSMFREAIVYPLVVLALWLLRPNLRRLAALGYLMGLTAILSIYIAATNPDQGLLRAISGEVIMADKQVLPGGLLVGMFTHPNNLGQFLAVGLPAIGFIANRWARRAMFLVCGYAILWSASRGAMLAVGVALLAYVVMRLSAPGLRRLLGPLAVAVNFAIMSIVPFVSTTPTSFSNRGLIWQYSLDAWSFRPWTGFGIDWYQAMGLTSARLAGSVFHGHNQLIQFLITGGLALALIVLIQVLVATFRSTSMAVRGEMFGIVWLCVLAATSVFEKSFTYVDNRNFLVAMVVPMAFLMMSRRDDNELFEGVDSARSAGGDDTIGRQDFDTIDSDRDAPSAAGRHAARELVDA